MAAGSEAWVCDPSFSGNAGLNSKGAGLSVSCDACFRVEVYANDRYSSRKVLTGGEYLSPNNE
jgi:hypothetical protein